MRRTALICLALALAATPALAGPKSWDQTWTVDGTPDVHVVADDAHVRILAGPAGKVSTHIVYELKRWGLLIGVPEPTVVFERKDGQIWITARDPRHLGVIGGLDERFSIDVTVPTDVTLNVKTGDGSVDCEPIHGRLTFVTGDGAVRAHGLRGDIDISTGDGRVILDEIDGRLHGRTGDGRILVAGRFDELDLSTGDGRVEATARKGSKLIAPWNLESGDGSVTLRIPVDLDAMLDARSRDGRLNVTLPIQLPSHPRDNTLVGELNNGGPLLRVRTQDGAITLALSQ